MWHFNEADLSAEIHTYNNESKQFTREKSCSKSKKKCLPFHKRFFFPNRFFFPLFSRQLRQPILQDGHAQILPCAERTVRRKPVDLDDCFHQLGHILRTCRIPRGNRPDIFFPCYLHRRKIAASEIPVPQMERRNHCHNQNNQQQTCQPLSCLFLPLPHRPHPLSTITNFRSKNLCSQNFCSYISIENLFCQ